MTAWVASPSNLRKRDADQVDYLMNLTETVLAEHVRRITGGGCTLRASWICCPTQRPAR